MQIKNKHLNKIFLSILCCLPGFIFCQEEDVLITTSFGVELDMPAGHFAKEYKGHGFGYHFDVFVGKDIGMPAFIGLRNSFIEFESLASEYELFYGDFFIDVKHKSKARIYNLNLAGKLYPLEFDSWLIHVFAIAGLRHTNVRSTLYDLDTDDQLESYKDIKDYAFAYGAGGGLNYIVNNTFMVYFESTYSSSTNTSFYRLIGDLEEVNSDDPFDRFETFNSTIDLISLKLGLKFLF